MEDFNEMLPYAAVTVFCALILYGILSLTVAFTNVQNMMNWCQYKNGNGPWSAVKSVDTGKRWSPNPATIGLTGECINPGDKGL